MAIRVNDELLTQEDIDKIYADTGTEPPADQSDDTDHGRDDSEPLTEAERAAILGDDEANTYIQGERAEVFRPHDAYVSPVVRERERAKYAIGSQVKLLSDVEKRLTKITKWGDALPTDIAKLGQKARLAIGVARTAIEDGRNPNGRAFARDIKAKDLIVQKVAAAVAAVGAIESEFNQPHVVTAMVNDITAGLDKQRAAAQKALNEAVKAFGAWRGAINAAEALNVEAGAYGPDWHTSKDRLTIKPAEMLANLVKARDLANSEDSYWSGAYLTADCGHDVPPHTLEAMREAARIAPGSFAESVFHRLSGEIHPADMAARMTLEARDLRIINRSPIPDLRRSEQGDSEADRKYWMDQAVRAARGQR